MKDSESCFGQMCVGCRRTYTFQLWSVAAAAMLFGAAIAGVWATWGVR